MFPRRGIRPSKWVSALVVVMGLGMAGVGIFLLLFTGAHPVPVVIWIVVVLGVTGYHLFNLFTDRAPSPMEIVEGQSSAGPASPPPLTAEERLRALEGLREKKLVSDEEYEAKRREILDRL